MDRARSERLQQPPDQSARAAVMASPRGDVPMSLFVSVDIVAIIAASLIARGGFPTRAISLVAVVVMVLLALAMQGAYDRTHLLSGSTEYEKLFNSASGALIGLLMLVAISGTTSPAPEVWAFFGMASFVCLSLGRFAIRRYVYWRRRHGHFIRPTLVVGANKEGVAIAEQLMSAAATGACVVGFVDDGLELEEEPLAGVKVLGRSEDIEWLIREHRIKSVVVAEPEHLSHLFTNQDRTLGILGGAEVSVAWGGFESLTAALKLKEEGFVPLIQVSPRRIRGIHSILKSVLDYVGAAILLVFFMPLFILLAVLIRIDSRGPLIHRRRVVGQGGREFDAFKFRTMHLDGDARLSEAQKLEWIEHGKIKNDPRITKMGVFLRRTSMDELPQLFNVLLGAMSLVGPRMITQPEMAKFGRWQHSRATVKPGLTGLWQVSGRSDLSYEERVRLDIAYIRNHSIWLDLKILILTIPALLSKRGAY